jgi:aryl-alcohol dehydrogenase-like predicted oxidoreductase
MTMERRELGERGGTVTAVGYGTWAIGGLGYGDQDEEQALAAIDTYLEGGGRFIDTARGYGVSEIMVGKRLKRFAQADEVYVASKSGSAHPPIIATDCETSRFCLQRDAIDLYYVHVPPEDFDHLRRMLDVYEKMKNLGRIRAIGVSCRRVETPEDEDVVRRYLTDGRIDVLQIDHSLASRTPGALIEEVAAAGVGVVTRTNLMGGFLTGKWAPGHRFADKANDWRAGRDPEALDRVFALVRELADRCVAPPYENMAQLALAYCLHQPGVGAIIPGGRSPEQVRNNLAVAGLPAPTGPVLEDLQSTGAELAGILAESRKE